MNYFTPAPATLEDLKNFYRRLCKQFHPDKGGTTEQMQAINTEYERLSARLIGAKPEEEYGEKKWYKTRQEEADVEEKVRAAIEAIAHLDGLDIEIIGAWVWVGGDTKTHKDALKAAGYSWLHKREKWAFKGKVSKGRSRCSMEELRQKYGSEKVSSGRRSLKRSA